MNLNQAVGGTGTEFEWVSPTEVSPCPTMVIRAEDLPSKILNLHEYKLIQVVCFVKSTSIANLAAFGHGTSLPI